MVLSRRPVSLDRRPTRAPPVPIVSPIGQTAPRLTAGVTYAIGDTHGRVDLLDRMVARIRQRDGWRSPPDLRIVLLGDYIDRGPQSREVIARIFAQQTQEWCRFVLLKGNHEALFLNFLDGAPVGPEWLKLGGGATFRSFGVAPPPADAAVEAWDYARSALSAAVPPDQVAFLRGLRLWWADGDYLFVHAGVKPNVPLASQVERDLLWIRREFTSCERPAEQVVVHGHTITPTAKIERWRIAVDTGAYGTGVLSAVRLEGELQEVVQVSHLDWEDAAVG